MMLCTLAATIRARAPTSRALLARCPGCHLPAAVPMLQALDPGGSCLPCMVVPRLVRTCLGFPKPRHFGLLAVEETK